MSNSRFTMNGDARVQELTVEKVVLENRLKDRDREVERLEVERERKLLKIEGVIARCDVLDAILKEKDKAVEKLAGDQAKHFLELNNHQAVARQALNDADLKLTQYVTKTTHEAIINEWRARLDKIDTAVLRMADLIVISQSMETRLTGLEAWKERLNAVSQKTDEGSKFAWGIAGALIVAIIGGLVMLFISRAVP